MKEYTTVGELAFSGATSEIGAGVIRTLLDNVARSEAYGLKGQLLESEDRLFTVAADQAGVVVRFSVLGPFRVSPERALAILNEIDPPSPITPPQAA